MTAKIPNIEPIIAAGINPKTGLPYRFGGSKCTLKEDTKKFLRLIDEQDAVNRYIWEDFPANLTSQEVERLIYFKAQLCLFHEKNTDQFYLMPYALDGTIDYYSRFNTVHPVPMTAGKDDSSTQRLANLLSQKKLKCIYTENQIKEGMDEDVCVLLHDYTKQLSQTIIPRQIINDPIIDAMAECVPFMRTSLIASTGVKGVRVSDADQADSVAQANASLENAALTGEQMVPIVGKMEFQELTDHPTAKSEEYMLALQSLDNLRLSGYGIQTGGVFEKKAHELQTEADMNAGPCGLVLEDGLRIREQFANLVNKIWGKNCRVRINPKLCSKPDTKDSENEQMEVEQDETTTI